MDTRDKIIKTIKEMRAAGEKISINAVAKKCNISHALIYNRHPDLKEDIKEIQTRQNADKKAANDRELIDNLLAENKALKASLKAAKSKHDAEALNTLLAHLQEIYDAYDKVSEDRNELAMRVDELLESHRRNDDARQKGSNIRKSLDDR